MPDYILRMAAEYVVRRQRGPNRSPAQNAMLDRIRYEVMKVPAADVAPVVRCEKCKHVRPTVNVHTGEQVGIWCCMHDILNISPDDYCSRGEKKGVDG